MADIVRRLATIRKVAAIEPIPGADKIVKATVDGWELVTQKSNDFKVNELVLYFEIDSFIPVRPEFEWLRKSSFKSTTNLGDGFRIKTIRLRGQVSQGLILPLSDFFKQTPDGCWYYMKTILLEPSMMPDGEAVYLEEGTDLTEYFGVQKYEKPLPKEGGANFGRARGNFPDFIPKTDQERVQNNLNGIKKWVYFQKPEVAEVTDSGLLEVLNRETPDREIIHGSSLDSLDKTYFRTNTAEENEEPVYRWFSRYSLRNEEEVVEKRQKFEVTVKLDGSSMTVYHNKGTYGVCSRNLDLTRDSENVFWKTAITTGILPYMVQDGRNLAIQGELMGPGVQGNRENLKDHAFFVFDVYDVDQARYMTPDERAAYMDDAFNYTSKSFMHVPLLPPITLYEGAPVSEFLDYADKQKSFDHDVAEGVVFKSYEVDGPSFKAISNKFLLDEKD